MSEGSGSAGWGGGIGRVKDEMVNIICMSHLFPYDKSIHNFTLFSAAK